MSRSLYMMLLVLLCGCLLSQHLVRSEEPAAGGSAGGAEGSSSGGEEDAEEVVETETEEPVRYLLPSPDVATSVYFPDFPTKKITQGETVTALIALTNTGDRDFNVTIVGASLHSPFDYSYIIQNLTVKAIMGELRANSELTVEYKFKPDANLEPLEFHLSGFILYNNSDNEPFRSSFYNGTIELVERRSDFDARSLFTYVLVVSAVGLAAYVYVNANNSSKVTKKSVSREQGTRAESSEEWGANVYTQSVRARAVGSKKATKPSNKQ